MAIPSGHIKTYYIQMKRLKVKTIAVSILIKGFGGEFQDSYRRGNFEFVK